MYSAFADNDKYKFNRLRVSVKVYKCILLYHIFSEYSIGIALGIALFHSSVAKPQMLC